MGTAMTSMRPVLRFADGGRGDGAAVGARGASLGELRRAGIRVPHGFVVTTAAFRQAIEHLDAEGDIIRRITALDPAHAASLAGTTAEIRAIVESAPLPAEVADAVTASYAELCAESGE